MPAQTADHPTQVTDLDCEAVLAHEQAVKAGYGRMRMLFDEIRAGKTVEWDIVRGVPGARHCGGHVRGGVLRNHRARICVGAARTFARYSKINRTCIPKVSVWSL